MDITPTIQANSEQINATDLLKPVTVTITKVEEGTTEQPVFIHLAEVNGKTFRPAKTVLLILAKAWGPDTKNWIGKRLTIYNDETVKYAGVAVGGIRVSHLSHINQPLTIQVTIARSKRASVTIQPLANEPDTPADDLLQALTAAGTIDGLKSVWDAVTEAGHGNDPKYVQAKEDRKKELS